MPISFGTQTPGNQYVQLAQMLGRQNYNNGTTTGGLATVLQGLMQGYLMNKQMGAQTGANETLATALKAGQPWKSPDPVMAGPSSTDPAQMAVNNKVLYPAGTDVPGTGGVAPMVNVLASAPPEQGLGNMAAQLQMQDITARQKLAAAQAQPYTLGPGQSRYDAAGKALATAPAKETPPTIHRFIQNGREADRQWNPLTKEWQDVSSGPRWNPSAGGPNLGQQANNVEIDTARKQIMALKDKLMPGESLHDYLLRASQKQSDTGRMNPNYNPLLDRALRTASQHQVGSDSGYNDFLNSLDIKTAQPPAPAVTPPAPQSSGGVVNYLEKLFGGSSEPSAAKPAGKYADAPRDPRSRKAGTVYNTPKGPLTWTGTGWLTSP